MLCAACCDNDSPATLELSQQGCYTDSTSDPAFIDANIVPTIADMVPSLCVAACEQRGFLYAGIRVSRRLYLRRYQGQSWGLSTPVSGC